MASKDDNPSVTGDFTVIFIETSSDD
jgi:hypothetical protein